MSVQNNGEEIIEGTISKMTGMQKVPLGQQQSGNLVNNILEQNLKPELA